MTEGIEGKVVVITGASSGLGEAAAAASREARGQSRAWRAPPRNVCLNLKRDSYVRADQTREVGNHLIGDPARVAAYSGRIQCHRSVIAMRLCGCCRRVGQRVHDRRIEFADNLLLACRWGRKARANWEFQTPSAGSPISSKVGMSGAAARRISPVTSISFNAACPHERQLIGRAEPEIDVTGQQVLHHRRRQTASSWSPSRAMANPMR